MRSAILHLAFVRLAAREASSEALADNDASNAVSRALGYEPNGTAWTPAVPCSDSIRRNGPGTGARTQYP